LLNACLVGEDCFWEVVLVLHLQRQALQVSLVAHHCHDVFDGLLEVEDLLLGNEDALLNDGLVKQVVDLAEQKL